jgi:hypothetical protein
VSEQIVSKISSESETIDSMHNGRENTEASLKVKTSSQFRHAELIVTTGVIRDGRDFIARVVLDRDAAIKVYSAELADLKQQAERIEPALIKALESLDTSILLTAKWSPMTVLRKQREVASILGVLGVDATVGLSASQVAIAKRATTARSRAVIRLKVSGKADKLLRRAVVGELAKVLNERQCQFAIHDGQAPKEATPTADAHLRIVTRDHEEFGALWRYIGFELYIVDSRTRSPVFHLSALPEFVHAGGPSWAMADQALIRRLGTKLAEKYGATFGALACR